MYISMILDKHRLSTSLNADKNLVLNAGRAAEEGRYDDLVQQGGLFYEMVHKVDKPEEDEDAVPMEKIDMVSMAKGRGRVTAARRNTDKISATGGKPKQLHESALA